MYISPAQRRKQIAIFVLFGLLLLPSLIVGILLYQERILKAEVEEIPREVTISDVTENSAVISWVTPYAEKEGWVQWSDKMGISTGSPLALDDRDVSSGKTERRTTHYISLIDLQPDTLYYFVIGSGAHVYKNDSDDEYSFRTVKLSDIAPTPDPLFGKVSNDTGSLTIVYVTLKNSSGEKSFPLSALTNAQGNFELDLSAARMSDLSSRFVYNNETEMHIDAQGGVAGTASIDLSVGDRDDIKLVLKINDEKKVNDTNEIKDDKKVNEKVNETNSELEKNNECNPECDGKVCGPDGCGGTCGTCPSGSTCSFMGVCDSEKSEKNKSDGVTNVAFTKIPSESTSPSGIAHVVLTNVTENSFSVVWTSVNEETGFIKVGKTSDNLKSESIDTRDSASVRNTYHTHHVTIENCVPETTYYYSIQSGEQIYDNSGSPNKISIPSSLDSPPQFFALMGVVDGSGSSDAVVTGRVVAGSARSAYISASVGADGTWSLSAGGVRTQDYAKYFPFTLDDSIELTVWTAGNSITETYALRDVNEKIIHTTIEKNSGISDESESFDRGIYSEIDGVLENLPLTAVNRIAVLGLVVAFAFIAGSAYFILGAYRGKKNERWEQEILRRLDGE